MLRHGFSFFMAISLILHALFFSFMLQWIRADAQTQPPVIRVSLVPGPPQAKPLAGAISPARRMKPAVLPKVVPTQPITRGKKTPAPEPDIPQSAPIETTETSGAADANSGTDTGISARPGRGGGVPGAKADPNGAVNADRAFANARDAYTMELYGMIKRHCVYPALARRRGQEGRVQVGFIVGDDGRVQDVEVVASSGYSVLDRAAVETIRRIPLPPPPRRAMPILITIVYRLEEE